jgi:hypothetical protein
MEFSKISVDAKGVKLQWEEPGAAREHHQHTLESADTPAPEFTAAIEAFRPLITDLLKTPERFVGEDCEIRGFSLSRDADEHRGLVITLSKKLSKFKAPMTFNLPYISEQPSERPASGYMPDGMLEAIATLEAAAEAYVNGNRVQLALALEGAAA